MCEKATITVRMERTLHGQTTTLFAQVACTDPRLPFDETDPGHKQFWKTVRREAVSKMQWYDKENGTAVMKLGSKP